MRTGTKSPADTIHAPKPQNTRQMRESHQFERLSVY